jgi:hypothetical protein
VGALLVDAAIVALAASMPVAIEGLGGLEHAGGDLGLMFIPDFAWWWSRPRLGGGWNPWLFAGFPSNADPLVGHVHPLGVLWALCSPTTAAALEGAAAPALAGLGMLVYLRAIGCTRVGRLVGAISFACGGYVHAHAQHPEKLRSVLAIPWALAAIEMLDGPALVAGFGAAIAVLVAGGHPETIAHALVLIAAYVLALGRVREPRRAGALALGFAAGVAVPAVTWLPAIELVLRSNTVQHGFEHVDRLLPTCLHTLVVPFGCGGGDGPFYVRANTALPTCGLVDCTAYPGMVVWLLVLAALPAVVARSHARFWIVAGVVGLVVATGVVTAWVQIPGVRAPARTLLWWDLGMATTAALAVGTWTGRPTARGWWTASALLALVIAGSVATGGPIGRASLASFGVLAVSAFVPYATPSWSLVAVLVADLGLLAVEMHVGERPQYDRTIMAELAQVRATLGADPDHGRAIAIPTLPRANAAALAHVRLVQGWNVLVPTTLTRLLGGDAAAPFGWDFGWVGSPALVAEGDHALDLLRARVVLVGRDMARQPAWATAFASARWRAAGDIGAWSVYLNERSRPVAWLVDHVRVASDDDALRVAHGAAGDFDPAHEAIVREPVVVEPATMPGTVRIVEYDDDVLAVHVETRAAALLVTSELDYPGWTVTVDGSAAPIVSVDAGFRAVSVSRGPHEVAFRYRPRLARIGLGVGGFGLLILASAAALARRNPRPLPFA